MGSVGVSDREQGDLVGVWTNSSRNLKALGIVALMLFIGALLALIVAALLATCTVSMSGKKAAKINIEKSEYGETSDGRKVDRYKLRNANGMEVDVLSYGGTISSIKVPDRNGQVADVVLGCNTLKEYEDSPYFGSLVGRVANRIANAVFTLDGITYHLDANNGPNHLHGGSDGWNRDIWDVAIHENHLFLRLLSPDGNGGYPGEVLTNVTMTLTGDNELIIKYTASVTKKSTPINLTSHPYFNLGGHDHGEIYDHEVIIFADKYLPVTDDLIPIGISPVEGTIFDLRSPRLLGNVLHNVTGGGYDHNFCLRGPTGKRWAARVAHPPTGRILNVYTDQPGVQFYTGNFLDNTKGKDEASYVKHGGFCLETQNYPDAINQPSFPDSVLRPGSLYMHTAVYKFSTDQY